MCLVFNMAKMPKGKIACVEWEETQYLLKILHAKVQKDMQLGVEFPGYIQVKNAIKRYLAMLRQNQMDVCHPGQNRTA
jgi:saccharopine dehydrogenase-like NADP-dependent oxidoreductase